MGWTVSKLKRRLSALDISWTPRVAQIGGGDHVEAGHRAGNRVEPKLGKRERLFGQDRDQRILHLGRGSG